MELKATVLIDNIAEPPLLCEWGLSICIEYNGRKILLDTGKSGGFAENAAQLGVELADIDYGVLSNAHYDHADGMEDFFQRNTQAEFCLRADSGENCYSGEGADRHYIGIKSGTLELFKSRIRRCAGDVRLFDGAWLIGHRHDMLSAGKRAHMYILEDGEWQTDLFSHEQSLVFCTDKGLVVFNSCCHGGADVVVEEAKEALGGEVYALVGGLHLFRNNDDEVLEMAQRLKATGVKRIVTGHCTGDRGFELLRTELGDMVTQMYSGMSVVF